MSWLPELVAVSGPVKGQDEARGRVNLAHHVHRALETFPGFGRGLIPKQARIEHELPATVPGHIGISMLDRRSSSFRLAQE